MIDKRGKGRYVPVCDICLVELDECSSVDAAVIAIREEDWITGRDRAGERINICPACQEIDGNVYKRRA